MIQNLDIKLYDLTNKPIIQITELNMRLEQTNFTIEDVENCDNVAELLQELENVVKKLHEELETETIKTSVFRHKLTLFNNDLQKEIDENVMAVRQSNMQVINELKAKLSALTHSMEKLHTRDQELTQHIDHMKLFFYSQNYWTCDWKVWIIIFRPQKNSLSRTHQDVIYDLNAKMSDKAEAQIRVNETYDTLKSVNETVADMEEAIIQLKEQVVKEKNEARLIKNQLDEQRLQTMKKSRLQEELNTAKSKEVEIVKSDLKETDKSLRFVFRENEKLEQIRQELEATIQQAESELEAERAKYNQQVAESVRLHSEDTQGEKDYLKTKEETIRSTKEAADRTKVEIENLKELKEQHEMKKLEVKEVHNLLKSIQIQIDESKEM